MHRAAAWTIVSLLGALLLALTFTLGWVANGDGGGSRSGDANGTSSDVIDGSDVDFGTLNEIVDLLKGDYLERDTLDEQALYEAAISGMLDSLADTGTFYIDPISFQTSIGPSGSFEGIGATVQELNNQIIIIRPFQGSPAEAAGIKPGDAILTVDGQSTDGWTANEAVLHIRGPRGSEVTLSVRHLDGTSEELTIVRDEIRVESVSTTPPGGVLRGGDGTEASDLAYMHILEFTAHTPQEVEAIASEAESSGKKGLLIDMRGNPGGLLQETIDTADLFLDDGIILIEVDREDQQLVHQARPGGAALNIPIVILLDQYSASGSEVLAAALHDNDRAIVVGSKSFGKGTVNLSHQLGDGGALFYTIRRWLTPEGVQIDGVGITPDIEVTPGPFDPQYDPLDDVQIFRAIEHLRSLAVSTEPAPAAP